MTGTGRCGLSVDVDSCMNPPNIPSSCSARCARLQLLVWRIPPLPARDQTWLTVPFRWRLITALTVHKLSRGKMLARSTKRFSSESQNAVRLMSYNWTRYLFSIWRSELHLIEMKGDIFLPVIFPKFGHKEVQKPSWYKIKCKVSVNCFSRKAWYLVNLLAIIFSWWRMYAKLAQNCRSSSISKHKGLNLSNRCRR